MCPGQPPRVPLLPSASSKNVFQTHLLLKTDYMLTLQWALFLRLLRSCATNKNSTTQKLIKPSNVTTSTTIKTNDNIIIIKIFQVPCSL
jgi:hypothetical protein